MLENSSNPYPNTITNTYQFMTGRPYNTRILIRNICHMAMTIILLVYDFSCLILLLELHCGEILCKKKSVCFFLFFFIENNLSFLYYFMKFSIFQLQTSKTTIKFLIQEKKSIKQLTQALIQEKKSIEIRLSRRV